MLRSPLHHRSSERADVDMAPMIDCVFLLLIFFIVNSVFSEDPGIEVQRPDVRGASAMQRHALLVAISSDNRVFLDGQEVRVDRLAALLRQAAMGQEVPLIIRADLQSTHATFAAVYAEAKRADLGSVQFATVKADPR